MGTPGTPTLDAATRVVAAREQLSANVSGEAVILGLRDGIYYGLQGSGARIWQLVQQPAALGAVAASICAEYEVPMERALADLIALARDLVNRGLLELFLKRLRSFARLPRGERRLALRAVAWLALARVALHVMPFRRLHAFVAAPRLPTARAPLGDWPRAVRRAMSRASRSLPGSSCLAQSLVAERLLVLGGHQARLSIGVARDAGPAGTRVELDAHAWVESGGLLVTGDYPHDRYQVIGSLR